MDKLWCRSNGICFLFHQFKTTEIQSKKVLVKHSTQLSELEQELQKQIEELSNHLFEARWQYTQFTKLKENLPDKVLLMVLDFAANYSTKHQDEGYLVLKQGYYIFQTFVYSTFFTLSLYTLQLRKICIWTNCDVAQMVSVSYFTCLDFLWEVLRLRISHISSPWRFVYLLF
jgi:hypothetical protein